MNGLIIGLGNAHVACSLEQYRMHMFVDVPSRRGLLDRTGAKARKIKRFFCRFHHFCHGETHLGTKYELLSSIIVVSYAIFDHKKVPYSPCLDSGHFARRSGTLRKKIVE